MNNDLDKNGRPYKCGPNWLPRWVFDEPLFNACCKAHDILWEQGRGKMIADIRLLRCCWSASDRESGWRKVRAKTQSVLIFLTLLLNPFSYVYYWGVKIVQRLKK